MSSTPNYFDAAVDQVTQAHRESIRARKAAADKSYNEMRKKVFQIIANMTNDYKKNIDVSSISYEHRLNLVAECNQAKNLRAELTGNTKSSMLVTLTNFEPVKLSEQFQ